MTIVKIVVSPTRAPWLASNDEHRNDCSYANFNITKILPTSTPLAQRVWGYDEVLVILAHHCSEAQADCANDPASSRSP